MPTVLLQYQDRKDVGMRALLNTLAENLPRIIAEQMNIPGHELHDGGVSEKEIIYDAQPYSQYARNTNGLQITVRAHRFEERLARINEMTDAIKEGVVESLRGIEQPFKIAVEVDLVDMGYTTT
ncbi:hypothetical protein KC902_01770 [Candidatus Kaiserbacteria bacterium]|nr:hypothetical protein [Candidatus Kaiserbacteria bacterium]